MRKLLIMLMTAMFAIGAAGALAACGSDSNSPEDAAREAAEDAGVDVNEDDGSVTFKDGDDSVTVGACSELPDGFPVDDVPLPDSDPQSCSRVSEGGEDAFALAYDLEGFDADEYKTALEDAGFEIEGEFESEANGEVYTSFSATSDDWVVNLGASGSGVSITVTTNPDTSG